MRRTLRTLATALFVALVGAGLSFGAAQAVESTPHTSPRPAAAQECGDDPHELGFCEDQGWDSEDCDRECEERGFTSGGCSPWPDTEKRCCLCTA